MLGVRTWTFLHSACKSVLDTGKYYMLHDPDLLKDLSYVLADVIPKYMHTMKSIYAQKGITSTDNRVVAPVVVMINALSGRPLGIEDLYPSISYISEIMNIDLSDANMVELNTGIEDFLCVYDVTDKCYVDVKSTSDIVDKSIEMHNLVGLLPYVDSNRVLGHFSVKRYGDTLVFDKRTLLGQQNPFSQKTLYVSVDGEPLKFKKHKFYHLSRYEVYQQRMSDGVRWILPDTSIYNALQMSSKKQTELINMRVRRLGIKPDDWIYTNLSDIKRKEDIGT